MKEIFVKLERKYELYMREKKTEIEKGGRRRKEGKEERITFIQALKQNGREPQEKAWRNKRV